MMFMSAPGMLSEIIVKMKWKGTECDINTLMKKNWNIKTKHGRLTPAL